MTVVYNLFFVCHLLGMAALVGGYFAVLGGAADLRGHGVGGARLQFVTGLILVGLGEAALDKDYNHVKIGVKLLLSLVVVALAEIVRGKQKKGAR